MTTMELSLLDELACVEAKAEIIDGRVIPLPMFGRKPTFESAEVEPAVPGWPMPGNNVFQP